jgi:hypothetical protein
MACTLWMCFTRIIHTVPTYSNYSDPYLYNGVDTASEFYDFFPNLYYFRGGKG